MKPSYLLTMLLGLVLIAVITPLSQFLTIMTVNTDMETALPMGWAVGTLFAIVLAAAPLRVLQKRSGMPRPHLVILYTMLTIAVPVMNIGMVRQLYLTFFTVPNEYLNYATGTYRTAYNSLDGDWFPVVPDREGLAWNKADRLIGLLRDNEVIQARGSAKSQLLATLSLAGERMKRGATVDQLELDTQALLEQIELMGGDEIRELLKEIESTPSTGMVVEALELNQPLEQRLERLSARSAEAAERLPDLLESVSERAVSLLPFNYEALKLSERDRIDRALDMLNDEQVDQVMAEVEVLQSPLPDAEQPRWQIMRELATALSRADLTTVRTELAEQRLAWLNALPEEHFDAVRADFVFRLSRDERLALWSQAGQQGDMPNLNLEGYIASAWKTVDQKNIRDRQTFSENLQEVVDKVPWRIWVKPLVLWSIVFLAIFLLMMCLAEWLRRKWIERENLAFPLVDVADHFIRHDTALELSEDSRNPIARSGIVNPLMIFGMIIGFGWLCLEALNHYDFMTADLRTSFNVSEQIFTQGFLKSMNRVFFVLSPIILGIAFLVSLEISFSIWVIFILMNIVWATAGDTQSIKDPLETGWGGGRDYPFPMEQMFGAMMCFAGVLVWKLLRGRSTGQQLSAGDDLEDEQQRPAQFVPGPLALVGLIGLPILIIALFWSMGMDGLPGVVLSVLFLVVMLGEVIAASRVRAETGFPSGWVTYTFLKIPIVFGLTEFTGASRFIAFIMVAFVPGTLLMRSLGQHLENIELARRHRMRYAPIAVSALIAFIAATGIGMISFLLFSYYIGQDFSASNNVYGTGMQPPFSVARYSLWVSHFLGESGLDQFNQVHGIRVWFMIIGAAIFGGLTLLRNRFLKFPLHPMGYLVLLISTYYAWVSYYGRSDVPSAGQDTSWLWGSVFAAWLIKFLVVKYGGMTMYKKTKPLFIGLVLGSVLCIFTWNVIDLGASIIAAQDDFSEYSEDTQALIKHFTDQAPYSPNYY